jgi:SpoVK/Ycf46/Vps4 family AAA+-type ATPase
MTYPLITVRLDAVISSFLGETAANLRRVFEFVERGQWIVLFDEFDAIGKERDNPFEHGELKRVVNSLLQLMDAYHGDSLLIASTNHEGSLDSAVWRRFDAVIAFSKPTMQDRLIMLRMFLRGFHHSDGNLESTAKKLAGATGADLERVAIEAVRHAILDGRKSVEQSDLSYALSEFQERRRLMSKVGALGQSGYQPPSQNIEGDLLSSEHASESY